MFRLEDEIARWRSAYEHDLAFTEEDIAELASHLRSSFEGKIQEGLCWLNSSFIQINGVRHGLKSIKGDPHRKYDIPFRRCIIYTYKGKHELEILHQKVAVFEKCQKSKIDQNTQYKP